MNKWILIVFLLSVFFVSFLPVKDTDFGWHYRCGKQFFDQKSLCTKNEFSYFLPNYRSSNPSLFYNIILALTFDRFGFTGVGILGSIIFTLSALLFVKLIRAKRLLAITGFFLSSFLSYSTFALGLRSQIITYFFFLLALYLVEVSRKNKFYLAFFPLLFLFWVNTHIGFFLGPIILGFYFIDLLLKKEKIIIYVLLIMVVSFLTSLINPFGIRVFQEIVNHALSPLNNMIAEWVAPPSWQILFIVLLTAVGVISATKKKSLFFFFLIIFFSFLGLKARRNLPFFYTTFFYVFLNGPYPVSFFSQRKFIEAVDFISLPLLVSLMAFLLIVQLPKTVQFNYSWQNYCRTGLVTYPCQALKNFPSLSGNVYNAYEWGGFLIWQKPQIKVFVDGRMPAWKDENGKSPYQVYLEIIQTQPGWNEKLNQLKTNYLLIQNGTFLDLLLEKEHDKYGWQEKYRDKTAAIYKNTNF
ncbi:hypothetical protein COS31_05765 [Candidatus Roizmanbacteria bacterium CG02_land_8_20_14_3_00_36_15]|uniref:Glycosyltransferase RgtA/B/C/D-like domain-containing protein n=2 Tax=Candidatus Roizmaniibacteriota TaxID=1752723 RepID=A0A2M8KM33_9BACT|nr:MAG: hypothetical protein COS51_00055 [Candidatus Roizmanbacteria bacterium CG03_land_8_20_14_0_80_36_21]PIV37228.1 MAG: hypothetical protein COS31_05765 [Candidatus Roizmanbacteria bacterium CG02_land_8_20_14_3_00_36_15]PIY70609.1 MAG: hypothetical protein COY89_00245 [Candidatus Roizmanbacteria bacterium CG_4_10_14_0_8_um_filter_36_36]PJA53764.1 MAG: hypothetical protein CO166_00645 [Candidatus Roizmanbacteria bacterium CG_4_9_14_3_um_filter_36_11]PJC81726.1 MAG: hypothetical protein CO007